jgi:ketosteroid isomerase-like protein
MAASDLAEAVEQSHRALNAFPKGDAEPLKNLFSRRDDVSIANPFGPPARGWKQVAATMERAASSYRDGEAMAFERVSEYATADLAYIVEIERYESRVGGVDDLRPFALRVTTIFRREDNEWRILHRHADPITAPRAAETLFQ